MILINEWLPDPEGRDTEGEWLELLNTGGETVSLSGWSIETPAHARYTIRKLELAGGEYAVIRRSESKLSLANENGSLILFDQAGREADKASFLGRAASGKSWSRGEEGFSWTGATPGAINQAVAAREVVEYPLHVPLSAPPGVFHIISLAFITGIFAAAAAVVAIKNSNELQELFFKTN